MTTIRDLNDRFRKGDNTLGQYVMTSGVQALPPDQVMELIRMVQDFNDFTPDNDPHGERDSGKVTLDGKDYFFKIDYYDPSFQFLSTDPASPNATRRVMTLMRADEY